MDVKVGDVGTEYFVPTYDDDLEKVNFDPSSATTKQLIFRMPGAAALLTRTAIAAQKTIDGASVWGLRYTVTSTDLASGFHQEAGPIAIEGYVEFSSEQKWSSSIVETDHQGRDLKVIERLSA